jgi:pimeloyl-ACP methyl ester carboxylesterase
MVMGHSIVGALAIEYARRVSPHVLWDGIARRLPDATLEVFERSGHHAFFEEPERFATAVREWMTRARRS